MDALPAYQPPPTPLQILHQDKDLLVCHKPSGLLTNPGRTPDLADSLYTRVQAEYPTALLVHRLDAATSGVVVFALRRKAEAHLKQQFAQRQTGKLYLANVAGVPENTEGQIDLALSADLLHPPRNKVDAHGKPAFTSWRKLQTGPEHSVLALWPKTGRAHQLRVHLAAIGHPILGDLLYGTTESAQASPRLCLHAWKLALQHPYQGGRLEFIAPPDPLFFPADLPELEVTPCG